MSRARAGVVATAAAATAFTVAVALLPQLFHYRRPALHVALETAATLVALLAAFLVFGRFRRRARLNELLLACGLGLLALSNLLFGTLPTFVRGTHDELTVWAALVGSLLGALLFALAAFGPRRLVRRQGRMLLAGSVGVAAALGLTAALVLALGDRLPRGVAAELPESAARPTLEGHPALLALQLVVGGLYALAAIGFLRRSERLGDEFYAWMAVGAVLAAVARINYFLYPSLYSEFVYTGDAFRLAFYAVLLVGSMREISAYWRAASQAAVLEERRRIARDLHDGLAQELAYIGRNLAALHAAGADGDAVERLRRAVDRAQLESRQAITALTAPEPEAVEIELAEAASEVAERLGVELELDLVPGAHLSAARTEALVRIACEAVANAARHSGAETVSVSLERNGPRIRLRVADAGRGFDPEATAVGFGLLSMRERARSIGGELRIDSAPARGTAIEVTV